MPLEADSRRPLINLIGLIDTPDSGRIRINGTDLSDAKDIDRSHCRGQYISFIYQGFHLAPTLTVSENIELGITSQLQRLPDVQVRTRTREALEAVGMTHLAGQAPGTLSGGEQQRVAIARALARRTPLLLADEPTGNLDHDNASTIVALLEEQVRNGAALLLVTHDPEIAARADRRITPHGQEVAA